jgi:hypothetical protein
MKRGGSAYVGGFPADEFAEDGEENKREGGRDARDDRGRSGRPERSAQVGFD